MADFGFVDTGATPYGGNDAIDATGYNGAVFGDVSSTFGVLLGGDDTLTAGAGMTLIFGDADAIGSLGTAAGFAAGGAHCSPAAWKSGRWCF